MNRLHLWSTGMLLTSVVIAAALALVNVTGLIFALNGWGQLAVEAGLLVACSIAVGSGVILYASRDTVARRGDAPVVRR